MNTEGKLTAPLTLDFSGVELLLNKFAELFGFIYTTYLADIIDPFLPFIKDILGIFSVLFLACIIFLLFKLNKVIRTSL